MPLALNVPDLVLAVGEVDDRRLLQGRLGDIGGNGRGLVGVDDARHHDEHQPGGEAQGDHRGLLQGPVPPPVALAAGARAAVPAVTGPAAVVPAPAATSPGAGAIGQAGAALTQPRSAVPAAAVPSSRGVVVPAETVAVSVAVDPAVVPVAAVGAVRRTRPPRPARFACPGVTAGRCRAGNCGTACQRLSYRRLRGPSVRGAPAVAGGRGPAAVRAASHPLLSWRA